jgi:uncharacterized protein (DUF433 family)
MVQFDAGVTKSDEILSSAFSWDVAKVSVMAGRIESNPKIMLGKPVIRGTRIPVELILLKLSEGSSEADLLESYPRLTREDIRAALAYAAAALGHEETLVVETPVLT